MTGPLLPLLLAAAALATTGAPPAPSYRVTGSIAGPDGAGWDYASVDATGDHLFVAHGDAVTEVTLSRSNQVRSIGSIQHGHAVVPVPGTKTLLVTSGRDSSVRLIDLTSGKETASLTVGDDPDAAIIDPATGHVLTMNAHAGTVSEVDVAQKRIVRTIHVKPALEFAAIGPAHTLFINNEDDDEINTVDLATGRMGASIALTGCEGPTGMAYDAETSRLISSCANRKAAVVDARSRKLVALIDIGSGPDAVLLDTGRRLAFIPCGRDGVLDVLSLDAPGGVKRIASIKTEIGARTGALDARTGTIYLPTAKFGPPAKTGGRPVASPGTFHIVVVKPV
ncbi:MAG: gluconolactonase [Pseudomonadota bacterium]|nr:gluconolactonase [Pseudomonadota bacterium]